MNPTDLQKIADKFPLSESTRRRNLDSGAERHRRTGEDQTPHCADNLIPPPGVNVEIVNRPRRSNDRPVHVIGREKAFAGHGEVNLQPEYEKPSAIRKPRMNKLELAFYDILLKRFQQAHITPQFRLRVSAWNAPVQVHYTTDFLVSERVYPLELKAWTHSLYEVKGTKRRPHSDELTRPKMAREHNPWISAVVLATWDGEKWTERQIA